MTDSMMGRRSTSPRTRAWIVMIMLFLAGAACGAVAMRASARPQVRRQVRVRVDRGHAYQSLGLSPVQQQRVDSILATYQPRTDSLLQAALPRLRALIDSADVAVRRTLSPAQRARLDSLQRRDSIDSNSR